MSAARRAGAREWARVCGVALLPALLLVLSGCALWRPVTVPLRTIAEPARCAVAPDTLLVLLPGAYSLPEEFVREGFVQAVRERRLAVDLLLVDAHVGYYEDKSVVARLRADVVQPALARGYRHVWLAGISIGGLGAMIYAEAHPQDIDGVIVLAPYLGSRRIAQQIVAAGGLRRWPAPDVQPVADELDLTLWRWLRAQTDPAGPTTPLYLGHGLDDRFAYSQQVLAAALPAGRVFTAAGGHDWPVWRGLWPRVLDAVTPPWPVDPGCR